jgi:8-oxo-dGTP pyrophosphatase MutT (NUDIX family)
MSVPVRVVAPTALVLALLLALSACSATRTTGEGGSDRRPASAGHPVAGKADTASGVVLNAERTTPTDIDLRWRGGGSGASGHVLEFATEESGPYTVLRYLPPQVTSYRHPDLIPDTTFFYRLRAFRGPVSKPVSVTLPKGELTAADENSGHDWLPARKDPQRTVSGRCPMTAGADTPDRRGRTGLDRTGLDLTGNPRVKVRDVTLLSSHWYVERTTTFDFQHADGTWTTQERETHDRGNGATLLLYDAEREMVLLTRQFRFPVYVNGHPDGMLVETPGGLLDDEDEHPEEAVRREVVEETGHTVGEVEHVFDVYMSPGSVTERIGPSTPPPTAPRPAPTRAAASRRRARTSRSSNCPSAEPWR